MNKEFTSFALTQEGIQKVSKIRNVFDDLLEVLKTELKQGLEFSLVCTRLEEASFFAIKSVSFDPDNQQKPA